MDRLLDKNFVCDVLADGGFIVLGVDNCGNIFNILKFPVSVDILVGWTIQICLDREFRTRIFPDWQIQESQSAYIFFKV